MATCSVLSQLLRTRSVYRGAWSVLLAGIGAVLLLCHATPVHAQSITISDHAPVTNAVGVNVSAPITVSFDAAVQASTVTTRTFTVRSSFRGLYTDTATVNENTVTVDPSRDFFAGEQVQVVGTAAISSTGGAPLPPAQWGFTTGEVTDRCVGGFTDSGPADDALTGVRGGSVAWGDYDNDGDLDILLTGQDASNNKVAKVYRNDDGVFVDGGAVLTGVWGASVVWGDYDNDGDLDILLTGEYASFTGVTKVYRNNAGSFIDSGSADDALTSVGWSSVAWGDYDNDGDLDILLTGRNNSYSMVAKIYRNNGSVFVDSGTADDALTGVMQGSVAWGDYDNDGDLDILLTGRDNGSSDVAKIYRNEGGVFVDSETADDALAGVRESSVAWADYDNDGDLDILLTGYTGASLTAKVYRNDDGVFVDSGSADDAFIPIHGGSVAWGDYDNDGDLDILFTGWNISGSGVSKVYRNDSGVFVDSGTALIGVGSSSVAWGDYDSDRDLDILLTGSNQAKVYRNNDCADMGIVKTVTPIVPELGAAITYTLSFSNTGPSIAYNATVTDSVPASVTITGVTSSTFGSGAVITQTGGSPNFAWTTGDLAVGAGGIITLTGTATDLPGLAGSAIVNTAAIAASNDITFSNNTSTAAAHVLFRISGHAPVTNAVGVDVSAPITASFDAAVQASTVTTRTFTVRSSFRGLYTDTATLNGNTVTLDLSRDFFAGEQVQVVGSAAISSTGGAPLNPAQWGFTAGEVIDRCVGGFTDINAGLPGVWRGSTAWGDYDNDGDLDLILFGQYIVDVASMAKIYRNDGGVFVDSGTADDALIAASWSSVAWGDYDNDGDLDLLLTGQSGTPLSKVYRNNGGVFVDSGTADDALIGLYRSSVAWGDYDNDGDLDILIAGQNASLIQMSKVYRNEGGVFVDGGTADDALTGIANGSVAWGDYDNDGDLDILLTGGNSGGRVSKIYRNDDGVFVDSGTVDDALINVDRSRVAWGDYDNDGDLDILLTGNDGSVPVSKVYRNDDGIFVDSGTADDVLTGVFWSSAAWGDYDNDGDLDIILTGIAGSGSGITQVYRNDDGVFVDDSTVGDSLINIRETGNVAWGDYDNDGDLDILLNGPSAGALHARVYRNDDCADLDIVKTVAPVVPEPSAAITYTLSFSNAGPGIAYNVTVTDSMPVSVTITGVTSSTFGSGVVITQTGGSPNFAWTTGDLAVGAGSVITLTGTVNDLPGIAGSTIVNMVAIAASNDVTLTNNTSSAMAHVLFRVSDHAPVSNAVGVDVSAPITVSFDAAVQASTVTTRTFTVRSSLRGLYTDTATVNGNTLTLDPGRDFFAGEQVQVVGTAAISSTGGAPLNPAQWGFIAGPVTNRCGAFVDSGTIDDALTGVSASSVAWGDYDNDGDLDILLTGSATSGPVAKVYRNDNGSFVESGVADDVLAGVGWGSAAWWDYDNDGNLDILLTGWDAGNNRLAKVYRNDNGSFADSGTAGDALTGVSVGSVAWGDYDNDGDLDVLLTGQDASYDQVAKVYRNDNGSFVDSGPADDALTGVESSSVAWGDYDNDGDLDILLTGYPYPYVGGNPVAKIYRNDNGSFVESGMDDDVLAGVLASSVAWGDYDNDGDIDILLTGLDASYSPMTNVYRNDNGNFADSGAVDDALTGVGSSSVAWGDYDNDGDLDILLTGHAGSYPNSFPVAKIYRNDNGSFADSGMVDGALAGVYQSSVAWGDYDNDGDLDILLTGRDSSDNSVAKVYRNVGCTTTALTDAPNPSVFGQTVTFTATVSAVAPGAGTPTGVVTFTVNSAEVPVSLVNGVASYITDTLIVGSHGITATYGGDGSFAGSVDDVTQVVNRAATSTALTDASNPTVFGQAATFTATVSAVAPGAGTPTGVVTFTVNSANVTTNLVNGVATYVTNTLAVGSHVITATYGGDASFTGSVDDVTQVVNRAATSTAVASDSNPSVFGQSVTFTTTVSAVAPGAGTPTGVVTFTVDSVNVTANLVSGVATYVTDTLLVGSHVITATYGSDTRFAGSMNDMTQVVNRASTSTALTDAPNPSVFGQAVTFTATVSAVVPGAGTPTGLVTFTVDSANVTANLVNGVATYVTDTLPVASHVITATYGGDGSFAGSVDDLTQVVNRAGASTVLANAPDPSVFGQSVTFTATVSAGASGVDTPTGVVTFTVNSVEVPVSLVEGVASYVTDTLIVGSHVITATYSGDGSFAGSADIVTQVVNRAATSTALTDGPNPSVFGQAVTITATVNAVAPGAGTPTGVVTFTVNSVDVAAVLVNGVANYITDTLPVASHVITATYGGDGSFAGSADDLTQVVNRAGTSTTVASTPNPSVYGESVTITATLVVSAPGAGTPTGVISFTAESSAITGCSALAVMNGMAICTTALLDTGAHTITADYGGDANFLAGTGTLDGRQQVDKAATAAVTSSAPNPSTFKEPATFTATVSVVAPGAGTPTGVVTFTAGVTPLGAAALDATGVATVTNAILAVGDHAIGVQYGGDADFRLAAAAVYTHTVAKAGTGTALVFAPNPARVGEGVHYTATVVVLPASVALFAPPPSGPTGSVRFTDPTGAIDLTGTLASGVATAIGGSIPAGSYTVTATYLGDASYSGSASTSSVLVVQKYSSATQLMIGAGTVPVGSSVDLTVTVTLSDPTILGGASITGTVDFLIDGTSIGGVELVDGRALRSMPATAAGAYTVTARYLGNDAYAASDSEAAVLTVEKYSTQTVLSATPNPAQMGESVVMTATVARQGVSAATLSAEPTGQVQFYNGATLLDTADLAAGAAVLSRSDLPAGVLTLTAVYLGDASFAGSTSEPVQQVVQAPLTARNDAAGTLQGEAVQIDPLANDIDPAGGGLVVSAVEQPAGGSVVIDSGDKTVTFTPDPAVTGIVTFTYTARDIYGITDDATVAVVVTAKSETGDDPEVGVVDTETGGTLDFGDGAPFQVQVQVPPGIYPDPLGEKDVFYLVYTRVLTPTGDVNQPPGVFSFAGMVFDLAAFLNGERLESYEFPQPVTLVIAYDPALLGNLWEQLLTPYYWSGTAWSKDGLSITHVDTTTHEFTIQVWRLAEFVLFSRPPLSTPSYLFLPAVANGSDLATMQAAAGAAPQASQEAVETPDVAPTDPAPEATDAPEAVDTLAADEATVTPAPETTPDEESGTPAEPAADDALPAPEEAGEATEAEAPPQLHLPLIAR